MNELADLLDTMFEESKLGAEMTYYLTTIPSTLPKAATEIRALKRQRNELLAIIKAIQDGEEMSPEFCQRIDRVMEECGK